MQSVHGPSVYRTVPSAQYKPQHTHVAQWYQYYCDITLAHVLLPVTVIWRLPFTLLFLTSFLLAFFWPKLTTSVLGLMHLTLPMMYISFLNKLPCRGWVMKSATISLVGHQLMLISFIFTRSVIKKYRMLICLVRVPLEALPFCSSRIELLLSCNNKFSMIPNPCDNRK